MLENTEQKQDREQGNIQYSYPSWLNMTLHQSFKFTQRILFAWFLPVTSDEAEEDCRVEL